jgi:hypothetical protein
VPRQMCFVTGGVSTLLAMETLLACGTGGHSPASSRSAVIVGWVVYAGGPRGFTPEADRRVSGSVLVEGESRGIAHVSASRRSGFRVMVVPGRYVVTAIARGERKSGCPPQSVTAASDKTVHVNIATACLVG